jgi:magnesium chelatase family protein
VEGVLGGGRTVKPGEISLAHRGVLFLDEAPEFRSNVLGALREPLEDGVITIARADGSLSLPADFQLVLAANPCPCGRLGSRSSAELSPCFCSAEEISRYWRRLGSALLDRIELRVPVSRSSAPMADGDRAESSAELAPSVLRAVEIQRERYARCGARRNARLPPALVDRFCGLEGKATSALAAAAERLSFSARAVHSCLRVARTIADLEGAERIGYEHVLEAVQHRRLGDDPFDIIAARED